MLLLKQLKQLKQFAAELHSNGLDESLTWRAVNNCRHRKMQLEQGIVECTSAQLCDYLSCFMPVTIQLEI